MTSGGLDAKQHRGVAGLGGLERGGELARASGRGRRGRRDRRSLASRPTVGLAVDRQASGPRSAGVDEPLDAGDEVVEDVLFVRQTPAVVPGRVPYSSRVTFLWVGGWVAGSAQHGVCCGINGSGSQEWLSAAGRTCPWASHTLQFSSAFARIAAGQDRAVGLEAQLSLIFARITASLTRTPHWRAREFCNSLHVAHKTAADSARRRPSVHDPSGCGAAPLAPFSALFGV